MAQEQHKDTSKSWLVFFFICFALVLIGIVVFFARDINSEKDVQPAAGEHGSFVLPDHKDHAFRPLV